MGNIMKMLKKGVMIVIQLKCRENKYTKSVSIAKLFTKEKRIIYCISILTRTIKIIQDKENPQKGTDNFNYDRLLLNY